MKPEPVSADSRDNLRGALAMMAGMGAFITNDLFVKLASETLPTGQTIFLRGLIATLIIVLLVVASGAQQEVRRLWSPAVGFRSLGEVGSTLLYLTALFHIPIANATAILQAMPLIMTLAAWLVLGEVVRWRRWMAVAAGFIGMLMIVQPGADAFSPYSLFAVGSLAFVALRDLSTRYIPLKTSGLLVSAAASVAVTLAGGLLSLSEDWVAPGLREVTYLASAAAFLTLGYVFLIEAMRRGEMSAVAPFRYTILLWAIVYGYLVWGELPNLLAVLGFTLIVVSGLYVFYRERRLRRERPIAASTSVARQ